MIPLYRTTYPERTVNLLASKFRCVLVDTSYWCIPSIRFRPDAVTTAQVYFAKTTSQINLWHNNGGVLINWNRNVEVGRHDAMYFAECPRSVEYLDKFSWQTRSVVVIYEPPTWRVHEESLRRVYGKKSEVKRRAAQFAFERMRQLHDATERLTPASLARLLLAHQEEIAPPSSAPVLPEGAEHVSHTGQRVL